MKLGVQIAILASAGSAFGAGASWVSQGPFGGDASSVAIDTSDHSVYAGNFGAGVMKSTDMGLHWTPANTGLGFNGERDVQQLAASPTDGGRVVIGTQNGIWLTTDGGASWSPTNVVAQPGQSEGPSVDSVAFAPSDASHVYAVGDSAWYSTDSGATWTVSNTDIGARSVAVDPTAEDTVYAGDSDTDHVFKSTDGGVTWQESDSGLPATEVWSILVDPDQPATIIAGTRSGIFRSTDHGATWSATAGGPPGLANSQDETPYGLSAATVGGVPTIYAASDFGGLFASTDHGANWSRLDQNLATLRPNAIAIDTAAGVGYAATRYDLARSTDGGVTWSPAVDGYTAQDVSALAFDPHSPESLLAGTFGEGLFRSTDSGRTWTLTSEPEIVFALFFDRQNPAIVYFCGEPGVFKSTNGGASWAAINNGLPTSVEYEALAQSGSGGILLTGNFEGALMRSTDGGASWQPSATGLPKSGIQWLAADPGHSSSTFLAWAGDSIFRSTDGGLHWTKSATGYPGFPVKPVLFDPFDSAIVLAGSPSTGEGSIASGAWRSQDGGQSWTAIAGALASQSVGTFAADPAHAGVLYASTFGRGVFRSTDHGATWTAFTEAGLANPEITVLAVEPHGWTIQAGTTTSTFQYTFAGKHPAPVPLPAKPPKVKSRPKE